MDKINDLIYRIITGQYHLNFDGCDYIIKQPSFAIKYKSQLLYNKILMDNRFKPWISMSACYNLLINKGLLKPNFEDLFKKMESKLDDYKVELYQNVLDLHKQKRIKVWISNLRYQMREIEEVKNSLRSFTLEGFADTLKYEYMFIRNVFFKNGKRVSINEIKDGLLSLILNNSMLQQEKYREVARSNQWRTYYKTTKKPFPNFKYLTDEQQQLISYTQMYDAIYKNPNCPADYVIEDDDTLDGWMILQRREAENTKKGELGEKMSSKLGNAQDIFVVAHSEEERRRIDNMNSPRAQTIKNQRNIKLQQQGKVGGGELPDKQIEKFNQARSQYLQHVKGNR